MGIFSEDINDILGSIKIRLTSFEAVISGQLNISSLLSSLQPRTNSEPSRIAPVNALRAVLLRALLLLADRWRRWGQCRLNFVTSSSVQNPLRSIFSRLRKCLIPFRMISLASKECLIKSYLRLMATKWQLSNLGSKVLIRSLWWSFLSGFEYVLRILSSFNVAFTISVNNPKWIRIRRVSVSH